MAARTAVTVPLCCPVKGPLSLKPLKLLSVGIKELRCFRPVKMQQIIVKAIIQDIKEVGFYTKTLFISDCMAHLSFSKNIKNGTQLGSKCVAGL